jgi:transaldolase
MNIPLRKLHDLGQRIWLDNISRGLLKSNTLRRYIDEFSITGLTSNPTIFERAIGHSDLYDKGIAQLSARGLSSEGVFFELALEDLLQAADLFGPIHDASAGADGWVSLEVSPALAYDTGNTIKAACELHTRAACANMFIKIPGTTDGIFAIEQSIFNGVPVNVTLLFSSEHYIAAGEAYMRGIERRLVAGLHPRIESVASMFVSRWDVAVEEHVSPSFHARLGIAMAMRTYKAHHDLLASERWARLAAAGARPQRLLWASTGTKDETVRDTLYIEALAAPGTINTIPEKTLLAFADHGHAGVTLPADGGFAEAVLAEFRREGIDDNALAERLQRDGIEAFAKSWRSLMSTIAEKSSGRKTEKLA